MSSDKQLIEGAGKAIGLTIEWHQEMSGEFPVCKIEGGFREWNPLRRRVDAQVLSEKLGINLDRSNMTVSAACREITKTAYHIHLSTVTKSRYWVNDETRYVRATVGEAVTLPGWREVTGAEFDSFRAETRAKHPGLFKGKGKAK